MSHQDNIARIKTVLAGLGELQHEVVFVGGSTVSFYADRETVEIRETDDVDVIINVLKYRTHAAFEEKLRAKGFVDDIESGIKGRFRINGITVDVMPTTDVSMGFENKWYPDGFDKAMDYQLDENTTIKILTPPHFIATKMEAFKDRGASDPRQSQDFEDIIYLLENRTVIWAEMQNADRTLKKYLGEEFGTLVAKTDIYEWVDCHVEFSSPPSTTVILNELQKFCDNAK